VPRGLLAFLTMTLLLAACGCSGKDSRQKVCYPVEGQVMVKSQPAAGAIIAFQPAGGHSEEWFAGYPQATVESDGSFHVVTYGNQDGAPAGDYVVTIIWPGGRDPNDEEIMLPDKLEGKYADAKKTPLKAKVENGPTKLPAFNIP
jgi:hypothetical protein